MLKRALHQCFSTITQREINLCGEGYFPISPFWSENHLPLVGGVPWDFIKEKVDQKRLKNTAIQEGASGHNSFDPFLSLFFALKSLLKWGNRPGKLRRPWFKLWLSV